MHAMVDYYFNYSSKASQLFAHKKINRAKELFLACGVCLLFYLYHSQWAVAMINRLVLVATTCYIQNFKILLPCFLFSFLCCQRSQNTLDWWLSSCSYHIHCSCRFLYVVGWCEIRHRSGFSWAPAALGWQIACWHNMSSSFFIVESPGELGDRHPSSAKWDLHFGPSER